MNSEQEQNLIHLAQNGDDSARDELLLSYGKLVRTIARSIEISNLSLDYDDLFQVGNIGLLRAIGGYNENSGTSFKTYASRCIKNAIIDELRKKSPLTIEPLGENDNNDLFVSPSEPEKDYIDKESASTLFESIHDALTDAEFEILRFYLDGRSYAEISNELGLEKKKVDNTLYSIKKKIKNLTKTS